MEWLGLDDLDWSTDKYQTAAKDPQDDRDYLNTLVSQNPAIQQKNPQTMNPQTMNPETMNPQLNGQMISPQMQHSPQMKSLNPQMQQKSLNPQMMNPQMQQIPQIKSMNPQMQHSHQMMNPQMQNTSPQIKSLNPQMQQSHQMMNPQIQNMSPQMQTLAMNPQMQNQHLNHQMQSQHLNLQNVNLQMNVINPQLNPSMNPQFHLQNLAMNSQMQYSQSHINQIQYAQYMAAQQQKTMLMSRMGYPNSLPNVPPRPTMPIRKVAKQIPAQIRDRAVWERTYIMFMQQSNLNLQMPAIYQKNVDLFALFMLTIQQGGCEFVYIYDLDISRRLESIWKNIGV
jgi:hypothetical protein